MNPFPFTNKVAIITGGGTGIGKATAALILQGGGRVVINGRRKDVLVATVKELDPDGERTLLVEGDISKPETSKKLVDSAVQRFGGLDILINNAGIFGPKPFTDHTEEDLDRYLDVILKGTFLATHAAVPALKKRGGGSVVNVGSMWGLQAIKATPSSAYSAAKAGVHMLTRSLAIELGDDHIRVNAVAPAVVDTPVFGTFIPADQVKGVLESFNSFHPLGRIGQATDVAKAIAFLASDESCWTTGAILSVDGGVMAGRV